MEHLLRPWPVRVLTIKEKDTGSSNIRLVSFGIALLVCEHPIQKRSSPHKPVSCWCYIESELGCQYGLLPIWWVVATEPSLGPCWVSPVSPAHNQGLSKGLTLGFHPDKCIQASSREAAHNKTSDYNFTARWCWIKPDISQALTILQITGYASVWKHSWADKQKH